MELYIKEDTHLAVKKGVAWLDTQDPDWVDKINLGVLDLQDCSECILGQLYDHYGPLHMDSQDFPTDEAWMAWTSEHGFAVPVSDWKGNDEVYRPLTAAWTEYINGRRSRKCS